MAEAIARHVGSDHRSGQRKSGQGDVRCLKKLSGGCSDSRSKVICSRAEPSHSGGRIQGWKDRGRLFVPDSPPRGAEAESFWQVCSSALFGGVCQTRGKRSSPNLCQVIRGLVETRKRPRFFDVTGCRTRYWTGPILSTANFPSAITPGMMLPIRCVAIGSS